jgi:hypothetical protein
VTLNLNNSFRKRLSMSLSDMKTDHSTKQFEEEEDGIRKKSNMTSSTNEIKQNKSEEKTYFGWFKRSGSMGRKSNKKSKVLNIDIYDNTQEHDTSDVINIEQFTQISKTLKCTSSSLKKNQHDDFKTTTTRSRSKSRINRFKRFFQNKNNNTEENFRFDRNSSNEDIPNALSLDVSSSQQYKSNTINSRFNRLFNSFRTPSTTTKTVKPKLLSSQADSFKTIEHKNKSTFKSKKTPLNEIYFEEKSIQNSLIPIINNDSDIKSSNKKSNKNQNIESLDDFNENVNKNDTEMVMLPNIELMKINLSSDESNTSINSQKPDLLLTNVAEHLKRIITIDPIEINKTPTEEEFKNCSIKDEVNENFKNTSKSTLINTQIEQVSCNKKEKIEDLNENITYPSSVGSSSVSAGSGYASGSSGTYQIKEESSGHSIRSSALSSMSPKFLPSASNSPSSTKSTNPTYFTSSQLMDISDIPFIDDEAD